jgi:glutamate racemase
MGKIGVFDSGIGGLTVLDELLKEIPNEDYVFYADSGNNPYGEKTDEELYDITSNIVDYLIDKDCKIIVIACNTATTRCIKYLRDKYKDIVFVGTEPAIKLACDNDYNNILVMATPGTIQSERTHLLVNDNIKDHENVILEACPGLAHAIETDDPNDEEEILKKIYEKYEYARIDAIVLGCTHYPHIKGLISKYFKNAVLLDGSNGVARETKRQLEKNNLVTNKGTGKVEMIKTK